MTVAETPLFEWSMDPAQAAVIANRFESVVREMSNTLLRTARSSLLATGRDFSCSVVTADDHLLSSAEGLPVHVFGSHLQSRSMREHHPHLREGDAFLDNDPYIGNTHHADHTILAPVFFDGEHLFTVVAKAHMADIGNGIPSTYHPFAKDIYEEGALCFSVTQVQRDYRDIEDVIRICRRRIRVPDQWYGDYLSMLGAARIGERRIKETVQKYGVPTIKEFVREWFDYSERRMIHAIRQLPTGTVHGRGAHDPYGPLEDGVPVHAKVTVDGAEGMIEVDLRDNIDCVPAGINQSEACAINNAVTGVFNVLESDIPVNGGSFRRLKVLLRENCVVGIPLHPTCCSMATTNVGDRLINVVQHAFSEIGEGFGAGQGAAVMGPGMAVISGYDKRNRRNFVNQLLIGANGGPATPIADGWPTYNAPCGAGLTYRDSVEIDEQLYPVHFERCELLADTGGAGRRRGAPAIVVEYGPVDAPMIAAYVSDGFVGPARGARGALDGGKGNATHIDAQGGRTDLPNMAQLELQPGELVRGVHGGGGGYGDPLERETARVLHDCQEGYVSMQAAEEVYGVIFSGDVESESLAVDEERTAEQRRLLAERKAEQRSST